MEKAIILLSGGLDSTLCLQMAIDEGYECFPLAVDYFQYNRFELDSAQRVTREYMRRNKPVRSLKLVKISGMDNTADEQDYIPARNLILLSVAAGFAETLRAKSIFIGVNASNPGEPQYPDCQGEFIDAIEMAITMSLKTSSFVKVLTPLLDMTKKEIIEEAIRRNVPIQYTRSCYSDSRLPCGTCRACVLRASTFSSLELVDPASP